MKFGDYSKSYEIRRLQELMGVVTIPELPEPSYQREVVEKSITEVHDQQYEELKQELKGNGLLIKNTELQGTLGEQLEYEGRKVCAYIRDQKGDVNFYSKTTGYRFHLTNCSTLQKMKESGREARYLITERDDGYFKVNAIGGFISRSTGSGEVKMELCSFCMANLQKSNKFFTPFSLREYFKKYNSTVPRTIRKETSITKIQTYTPDHSDCAREFKKLAKHKCQMCNVDCSNNQHLLHMHHRNGDPSNNNAYNIRILCAECHYKEPMHGHMIARFYKEINDVKSLKHQQGIPVL